MRAIDTNVLVRAIVNDDTAQSARAVALLTEGDIFIPVTVVLELSWVLRSSKAPREVILEKMREVLSLRNVRVQFSEHVFQALRWALQGMDFADALHLALSGKTQRFVSFDKDLIKQTRKHDTSPAAATP